MSNSTDVIVVGGGVIGMAHALAAWRAGLTVRVIERDRSPRGASIRNFGMIWPVGQAAGDAHAAAQRSRDLWLDLAEHAGFSARRCGSLHLAHRDDEWAVLQEFAAAEGAERSLELLDARATRDRCPAALEDGLIGSLWSPSEVGVDPREAIAKSFEFLGAQAGVFIERGVATAVRSGTVALADGRTFSAQQVFVCSGADFQTLYPQRFASAPLVACKLQMLRTAPQPGGWTLDQHLVAGLTLCHYASFASCPSLPALRERFDREMPEHRAHGIHVLVTQNALGELVIGDSHHDDLGAEEPFDDALVNSLIMSELARFFEAPDLRPAATWHGVYARHREGKPWHIDDPEPGVRIVNGFGGGGMTLSMGIGERMVADCCLAASV